MGAARGPSAPAPDVLNDKRYKLLEATMRRYGYQGHALIEALHTAQEAFGYLDDFTLRYIARQLRLPYSKVYGVATFYNYFTLKPQGAHVCVVCLGTACYIKGSPELVSALESAYKVKAGSTTADNALSLLVARCVGSCALAPVAVLDGEVIGKATPAVLLERVQQRLGAAQPAEVAS
ncbi:MAG: bidirectional hydrogenase complex protein HoxE [Thermoflexales bacterium]|nr:bidirectional hydrogenase complex protein HoxE [Thermoflexales bacterium]MCS7324022.1 bidirectional hydrogenase complex protein HoxE [Thermoflexales bacterium]